MKPIRATVTNSLPDRATDDAQSDVGCKHATCAKIWANRRSLNPEPESTCQRSACSGLFSRNRQVLAECRSENPDSYAGSNGPVSTQCNEWSRPQDFADMHRELLIPLRGQLSGGMTMRGWYLNYRLYVASFGILAILFATLLPPTILQAQSPQDTDPVLKIVESESSVSVHWQITKQISQATVSTSLPTAPYGGYDLPMQFVTVVGNGSLRPVVQLGQVQSVPWYGSLQPAESQQPAALDWDPTSALQLAPAAALPTSPVLYAALRNAPRQTRCRLCLQPHFSGSRLG